MNKLCLYCGKNFEGRKPQKYCSPKCSQAAQAKGKRSSMPEITTPLKTADDYYNHLQTLSKEIRPVTKNALSHTTTAESLLIRISDTHLGKRVENPSTGEIIFDREICERRLKVLIGKLAGLIDKVIPKHDIDELVITLEGDLVEGDSAYETIKSHIDTEPTMQVDYMTRLLWELMQSLHKLFPKVKMIRFVAIPGNHGKVERHAAEINNWDNVIYLQLKNLIEYTKTKWASIDFTTQDIKVFTVKGHRIMMIHKAPKDPDSSAARTKYLGWVNNYNPELILTAHWHHAILCELTDKCMQIGNPSLVGADSLSNRLGLTSQPRQWVIGISKKRIPTFMYLVDLKEV